MARAEQVGREIVLTMSKNEARSLQQYLSIHSVSSSISTYPIFEALYELVPLSGYESMDLLERTSLRDSGLVTIDSEDQL